MQHPSLDPHVAQLLDLVARAKRPPLNALDPADAKIAYEKSSPIVDIPSIPLEAVHDLTVSARDGHAIPIRTYATREASWADPLPLLVYFHGGGFTVGSIKTHDQLCRSLAAKSGAMVLSVDYRLGPDWKFPTAANDAFDVLQAAVAAIHARDEGLPLALQLLIYPGTTARENTPSHREFAEGYLLTQEMIHWFFSQYLRDDADRDDWRFAPLDAGGHGADVQGVCPAWIAVAGFDPIRDAGIRYANKLRAAEVPVELKLYEGMIHDFFKIGRFVPAVEDAHRDAATALRRAFGTETE